MPLIYHLSHLFSNFVNLPSLVSFKPTLVNWINLIFTDSAAFFIELIETFKKFPNKSSLWFRYFRTETTDKLVPIALLFPKLVTQTQDTYPDRLLLTTDQFCFYQIAFITDPFATCGVFVQNGAHGKVKSGAGVFRKAAQGR